MSTLAAQIEQVQPDCYGKLLSEPYFANVQIFMIREKRLDSQVNKALTGMVGRNGKSGATIEVLMPTLSNADADAPGPVCSLTQKFVVRVQNTINNGANGTGLSCEQIAVNIAQVFHGFVLGLKLNGFYAATAFYGAINEGPDSPYQSIVVSMMATFALSPLAQTASPTCSAPELTVTVVDNQPGGGSTLYYTTDGTFPGPGTTPESVPAGSSAVYSEPFTVESGSQVRVAAYYPGLAGSMVQTFDVN